MSRDLPPNPNLEHLKKQAKALLDTLRQQNADATLVDAQHVLAREYGFPSWPKLKAYVEKRDALAAAPETRAIEQRMATFMDSNLGSQTPDPGSRKSLFGRFTMDTRRALFFARYESSTLGRLSIRPEHVLLGVMRTDGRSSRDLWKTNGVTLDEARAAVVDINEPRDEVIEPVQIPFTEATKALFTAAADEADRLGHDRISTAHVVLALLRTEGAASSFLRARGITLEAANAAAAFAESPLAGEDL
jgi:hypothetical protein